MRKEWEESMQKRMEEQEKALISKKQQCDTLEKKLKLSLFEVEQQVSQKERHSHEKWEGKDRKRMEEQEKALMSKAIRWKRNSNSRSSKSNNRSDKEMIGAEPERHTSQGRNRGRTEGRITEEYKDD